MNDQCPSASAHLGTLVQAKAGGPPMHVIAIADLTENHLVRCAWHDETNEVVVGTFRPEDLVDLQVRRPVVPCNAVNMGAREGTPPFMIALIEALREEYGSGAAALRPAWRRATVDRASAL